MSFSDAQSVTLTRRMRNFAVRMSASEDELWLGTAVRFVQWNPPNDARAYTAYEDDPAGTPDGVFEPGGDDAPLRVHNWDNYGDDYWEHWKRQALRRMNDHWDDRLVLRNSAAAVATGGRASREIACRFHCWQVDSGGQCVALVYRGASRRADRYAGRTSMGGPRAWCTQIPAPPDVWLDTGQRDTRYGNINMLLSHNDIDLAPTSRGTRQRYIVHEMGHFLGLEHRCQLRSGSPAPRSGELQTHHPTAGSDVGASGDPYCSDSPNQEALDDTMGIGMGIHPWHGFAWLTAIQRISAGPGGTDFRRTTWTVATGG